MDAKVKKACPSCSQYYFLSGPQQNKSRLPLLQKCGHSCCDLCLRDMVKFTEPIVCKICQQETEIPANELANDLYSLFPMNVYMMGELVVEQIERQEANNSQENYYINLKEILNADETKGKCVECSAPTTKLCCECQQVLCLACYEKIHTFHIFKKHVYTDIESFIEPSFCSVHREKHLDYFCRDCKRTVCMDCTFVGGEQSCKNHDVISVQEANDVIVEELNDMTPKIDETYRRLTKTAVEIGHLLKNLSTGTGDSEIDKIKTEAYQHFSKLFAATQTHLQETMDTINNLKSIELKSLAEAKNSVEESIKKAVIVLKKTNAAMNSKSRHKASLSALLDEAKQVNNSPWYLTKENKKQDSLKITVNEDVCALVTNYVQLSDAGPAGFILQSNDQIAVEELPPAPNAPVFPPELLKDVREDIMKKKAETPKPKLMEPSSFLSYAPKYKSKSGSNSSLNSIGSDKSYGQSLYSANSQKSDSYVPVAPISPYGDSSQPKPLVEGSQELVYISHIISPDDFYVQRACHQGNVKEMLREFKGASTLPKPSLAHLAEGKLYLAFNKTDQEWQRCRVVSIQREGCSKPIFRVFCIDFGSTELVTLDQIRALPTVRMRTPPPLAVHCALANCAPKYGSWGADDAMLMQKVIDNKKALLHVRRISSSENNTAQLHCDLSTVEDGVSLLQALVFHERAKIVNPKLAHSRPMRLSEWPVLIQDNGDFRLKVPEEVVLTHVNSPDNFFVRRCNYQDTFDDLCVQLTETYSVAVTDGMIYCPEIGMFCVAHVESPEGGVWRRAVVIELPGRMRVRVHLPDTGETALVHFSRLRKIISDFAKIKALATECHLSGVVAYGRRWATGAAKLLASYAGKPLRLLLEEARGRGALGVALYDDDECINTLMVRHKFAISTGVYSFNKNQPIEDQPFTVKIPEEKQPMKKPAKPKLNILKKNTIPDKVKEEELEAKDKGPLKLEVKVLTCQSPSLLYVCLIDQQKSFKELFDALQEYYAVMGPTEKEWNVGEKCCTMYRESKTWRRAVIMSLQDSNATVFFTDFAIVDTVPISELRVLDPEFAKVGDGAIKCHLSGIEPALGGEWPSLTKEYLCEMLEAYQRIFITKNGNIKDKSLPVEVWVYHVIQGEALEPDRAEWRCLNKKIVEQGLAIPDKDQELTTDKGKDQNDDMISIFNITGSVREWLQLGKSTKPEPDPNVVGSTSETDDERENENVNAKFISEWLPPEPLATKEFVCVPTYVDGDGCIYLHDISQQGTLELIRNALEVRFRNSTHSRHRKWTSGQPCIAKFYLDNKFYRGRVLEADGEGGAVVVHYVDYGNEERCAATDLRSNIVLHEIPTQAHKCRLADIRPKGGAWDKTTLDYIHKSIVEKQCLVRVMGPAEDGVLLIQLKFDRLWINEHLVEFELAVYTDGRKLCAPKRLPAPAALDQSTDSGPDYLVDDASDVAPNTTRDWNELLDDSYTTYPDQDVGPQFLCQVMLIGQDLTFELVAVESDDVDQAYEKLFEDIQARAETAPPTDGAYGHKACVARFIDDGRWYRAAILQHNKDKQLVKVKYVDYGNCEIIPLSETREIYDEWASLPPRAISARIKGIALSPDIDLQLHNKDFEDTFQEKKTFLAKVIDVEPLLFIQLTNEDGSIPYEHLIENGVLVKTE